MKSLVTLIFVVLTASSAGAEGVPKPCARGGSCAVVIKIDRYTQLLTILLNGRDYLVRVMSAGNQIPGRQGVLPPPNGPIGESPIVLRRHPTGRMAERFSDCELAGKTDCDKLEESYEGLGNRPYSVFINDEISIHGALKKDWHRLGAPDSHSDIRVHPDTAKIVYKLIQEHGPHNVLVLIN